jgi:hypothetical protein
MTNGTITKIVISTSAITYGWYSGLNANTDALYYYNNLLYVLSTTQISSISLSSSVLSVVFVLTTQLLNQNVYFCINLYGEIYLTSHSDTNIYVIISGVQSIYSYFSAGDNINCIACDSMGYIYLNFQSTKCKKVINTIMYSLSNSNSLYGSATGSLVYNNVLYIANYDNTEIGLFYNLGSYLIYDKLLSYVFSSNKFQGETITNNIDFFNSTNTNAIEMFSPTSTVQFHSKLRMIDGMTIDLIDSISSTVNLYVNSLNTINLSTLTSTINMIAKTVFSLPFKLYTTVQTLTADQIGFTRYLSLATNTTLTSSNNPLLSNTISVGIWLITWNIHITSTASITISNWTKGIGPISGSVAKGSQINQNYLIDYNIQILNATLLSSSSSYIVDYNLWGSSTVYFFSSAVYTGATISAYTPFTSLTITRIG